MRTISIFCPIKLCQHILVDNSAGWVGPQDLDQGYLQVDLLQVHTIYRIITQGGGTDHNSWVSYVYYHNIYIFIYLLSFI